MYTDASGNLGYAAEYGTKWFVQPWLEIHAHYQVLKNKTFPYCVIGRNLGSLIV